MRVLIVHRKTQPNGIASFVKEQAMTIKKVGCEIDFFPIEGKGILGYVKSILELKKHLASHHFDIIHGHFLWSILVCIFQRRVKKIGSFHGSDLNMKSLRIIAKIFVYPFLDECIVVNEKMATVLGGKSVSIAPCGVDIELFKPEKFIIDTDRGKLKTNAKNILFSSSFNINVKNHRLAEKALKLLSARMPVNLIELAGFSREEVCNLMNRVDLVLLTSLWEGSPQVIKEAMACNCPIVSTDVGDVKWLFGDLEGHFITNQDPKDCAHKILCALDYGKRTNGRDRLIKLGLDSETIAKRILAIYKRVINNSSKPKLTN